MKTNGIAYNSDMTPRIRLLPIAAAAGPAHMAADEALLETVAEQWEGHRLVWSAKYREKMVETRERIADYLDGRTFGGTGAKG